MADLAQVYGPIYEEMRGRNLKNITAAGLKVDAVLSGVFGEGKKDERLCLAIYNIFTRESFRPTPAFDKLWSELDQAFGSTQVLYALNEDLDAADRRGVLHHTFMQVVGFDTYMKVFPQVELPEVEVHAVKRALAVFVEPYSIRFTGIVAVPTGLLLTGVPSNNVNTARQAFRSFMRAQGRELHEPYLNDICHATLLRFAAPMGPADTAKLLEIAARYAAADLGSACIDGFTFGPATWLMRQTELAQHIQHSGPTAAPGTVAGRLRESFPLDQCPMIVGHRGLEHTREEPLMESSTRAFTNHLSRGFGVEFDPVLLADGEVVLFHDENMTRVSGGTSTKRTMDCETTELEPYFQKDNMGLMRLSELLEAIALWAGMFHRPAKSFLHLKGTRQDPATVTKVVELLNAHPAAVPHLVVFDAKVDTARALRAQVPGVDVACSVSHPYDVERYSKCVGFTILDLAALGQHRDAYTWAWVDEWDRAGPGGEKKKFLTREVFDQVRAMGLKVGLVTPELHSKSPGLTGGDAHEDALDDALFWQRVAEILALGPDAVCTDYPEELTVLALHQTALE